MELGKKEFEFIREDDFWGGSWKMAGLKWRMNGYEGKSEWHEQNQWNKKELAALKGYM